MFSLVASRSLLAKLSVVLLPLVAVVASAASLPVLNVNATADWLCADPVADARGHSGSAGNETLLCNHSALIPTGPSGGAAQTYNISLDTCVPTTGAPRLAADAAAYNLPRLLRIANRSEAVRVGVAGHFRGPEAPLILAAVDGMRAAFAEYNRALHYAYDVGHHVVAPYVVCTPHMATHDLRFSGGAVVFDGEDGHLVVRRLAVVIGDTTDNTTDIPQLIANMSADVYTLSTGDDTAAIAAAVAAEGSLLFGPIESTRDAYQQYNPHVALTVPSPDAELTMLLNYLNTAFAVRRVAVLGPNTTTVAALVPLIATALNAVNVTYSGHLCIGCDLIFSGALSTVASVAAAALSLEVQAVVFLGGLDARYEAALTAMIAAIGPRLIVLTPFAGSLVVEHALAALATAARPDDGRVITSLYAPLLSDNDSMLAAAMATAFHSIPAEHRTYNLSQYAAAPELGATAMLGFATGLALSTAINGMAPGALGGPGIRRAVFGTRALQAHDFVVGPFSERCRGSQTVLCGCNAGARVVHAAAYDRRLQLHEIPAAESRVGVSACAGLGVRLAGPLVQLVAVPFVGGDLEMALRNASAAFVAGDRAGYATVDEENTSAKSRTELQTLHRDRLLTIATGSAFTEALTPDVAQLQTITMDPLKRAPLLFAHYTPRVLHLMATVQQEVHALSAAYAARRVVIVAASIDNQQASLLAQAARRSALTHGQPQPSTAIVTSTIAVWLDAASTAPGTTLLVYGLASLADVQAVGAYLARAGEAADVLVLLPFGHVRVWYEALLAAVPAEGLRAKIAFATSLPSWNPRTPSSDRSSDLMMDYHRALTSSNLRPSPQSLLGFVTERVLQRASRQVPEELTEVSLLEALDELGPIRLTRTLVFGGFAFRSCESGDEDDVPGENCEVNAVARYVRVLTLRAVTSAAVAGGALQSDEAGHVTFKGTHPEYTLPLIPAASSQSAIIAIAGGLSGVVFLVFLGSACVFWRSGRNSRNAPKDPEKPFTIMFTDIQSSTSLWAEAPEAMADAVATHHALIRALIAKHDGYEVKTIGDAFMIAFKHADDAVRLAAGLQQAFYSCDAFSPALDAAYLSFDQELLDEVGPMSEVGATLSVVLPPETYTRYWRGLRVRVGIHTAYGDIQKDPVTGGYDYYGTVVNTAARVESVAHGGQVLLTEATLVELQTISIQTHATIEAMAAALTISGGTNEGPAIMHALTHPPVSLRGLPTRVSLFQLECAPTGRRFPPLRLDKCTDKDDEANPLLEDDLFALSYVPDLSGDRNNGHAESAVDVLAFSGVGSLSCHSLGDRWQRATGSHTPQSPQSLALLSGGGGGQPNLGLNGERFVSSVPPSTGSGRHVSETDPLNTSPGALDDDDDGQNAALASQFSSPLRTTATSPNIENDSCTPMFRRTISGPAPENVMSMAAGSSGLAAGPHTNGQSFFKGCATGSHTQDGDITARHRRSDVSVATTARLAPVQVMAVVASLLAVFPLTTRRRELEKLCQRWRIQIPTAGTAKAAGVLPPHSSSGGHAAPTKLPSGTFGASVQGRSMLNAVGSAVASETATATHSTQSSARSSAAAVVHSLSQGDDSVGLCLRALSSKITPIATRSLQKAASAASKS